MQGVERLSLVAKVLMDTRLIELKRENETLKMQLFWRDHSPSMLQKAMAAANQIDGGPRCACLACIVGKRCEEGTRGFAPYAFVHEYDEHVIMSPYDRCHLRCQFKPWFEQKIREAGMRVVTETASPEGEGVRDEGQHFSNFGIADWNTWVYGSAVCSATSVENEDLAKLNQLFKTLYAHVCV
jgi:hypothetical protein